MKSLCTVNEANNVNALRPGRKGMRSLSGLAAALSAAALTLLLVAGTAGTASAQSSTYKWKYFSTGGPIYPWYNNDNSWGYGNTSGSGFMEMYTGQEYGWWSPVHTLPKPIWNLGSDWTWMWSSWGVNPGGRIDVCYDAFVQHTNPPNTSIQGWEIMIWSYYQNTQPIAASYNAQGQAIPWKTNVSIGGRTWNVYKGTKSDGYTTTTFIDQNQQSGESLRFRDFAQWCAQNGSGFGWNDYLESVGCGWEYANGWATMNSFGLTGF